MKNKSVSGSVMTYDGIIESCRLQGAMGLKPGKCYWNCLKVLESDECRNAIYVEGIAVKPAVSIHAHGWLEVDGEIIDPTQPTSALSYFPALYFQGVVTLQQAINDIPHDHGYQDDLPIYKRFGRNGERSNQFVSALVRAVREYGEFTPYDPSDEL